MYLFSDPGRWVGPLVLVGLVPLVLSEQQNWAGTAMLATSQAEYTILILAPAAAGTAAISARSAALHDAFLTSGSVRSRLMPLGLVVLSSFLWIAVAAAGIWIAVSLASTSVSEAGRPFAATFGVAASALLATTAVGAVVATRLRGVWALIAVPILVYFLLIVPVYLPSHPVFVLIPRSSIFFFPTAIPSPIYAAAQMGWMLTVTVALLLWQARVGRRRFIMVTVSAVAIVCVVTASRHPLLADYGAAPQFPSHVGVDRHEVLAELSQLRAL